MITERFFRRTMEERGYEPDEIEDAVDAWTDARIQDYYDRQSEDQLTELDKEQYNASA